MRIHGNHPLTHNTIRVAVVIAVAIALMTFLIRSAAL